MKFEMFKTGEDVTGGDYDACKWILEDQGFALHEVVDVSAVMKYSNGKANPTCGFAIVAPDGSRCSGCVQLVRYLDRMGLFRLC